MKQDDKKRTITFWELKKRRIWVSEKWVKNLLERGRKRDGTKQFRRAKVPEVQIQIQMKDLVRKILESSQE